MKLKKLREGPANLVKLKNKMAGIFGKKKIKKEEAKEAAKIAGEPEGIASADSINLDNVVIAPRITEKASGKSMNENVYVFNVDPKASKKEISKAVLKIYKVSPVKISVVRIPRKKIFVRGKKGLRPGGKKAYVYLKEGEKIEFV